MKNEYILIKVGKLKYNRIKSISVLKNELNSYGYRLTPMESKEIFDEIMSGDISDNLSIKFDNIFKRCLESILEGNEYEILRNDIDYSSGCFPDNWILPVG